MPDYAVITNTYGTREAEQRGYDLARIYAGFLRGIGGQPQRAQTLSLSIRTHATSKRASLSCEQKVDLLLERQHALEERRLDGPATRKDPPDDPARPRTPRSKG